MISVNNIGKSYGDRVLFAGAQFQLNSGERYGLIGANGSGKTTFLQILAGDSEPTEGTVSMPKRLRLGTLRQDQFLYENETILGVAMMGNRELWDAMVAKEELLANAHEEFDADRFGELEEIVQQHDGYTAEARAATILEGLGLPAAVHKQPLSTLSGGFKLRVLLAQVLASAPDVLLLDEPTNHLDILSIHWLEKFLTEFPGPVVVISHDHRFLDSMATHILDVDYETITVYHGSYTEFVESKREERERREKQIAGQEKEIARQQEFVNRFKAKASKARQAQSKAKNIERMLEDVEELAQSSRRYPTFDFKEWRPSGRDVLSIKGVKKAYGDKQVLHGVDLLVRKGDRLAIMGPNGIGKSTLLKIAMGDVQPDAGTVTWGYETHPGYFAQDHKEALGDSSMTAHDWLAQYAPDKDIGWIRGRLALMLFTGEDPKKKVSSLSGGESARLNFARIALKQPNVLVLDEPTNHLDLESIEALVEGLQKYEGTLILVSHDRWFIGQLATRIVDIEPEGITDYEGTYEEYVAFRGDDRLDTEKVVLKARSEKQEKKKAQAARMDGGGIKDAPRAAAPAKRLNAHERKMAQDRHAELMHLIEAAESRIAEIDALFAEPAFFGRTSAEERRRLESERTGLTKEAAALLAEWEATEEQLQTSS
jgi:ATPase subunit of ABC transporter with duplicated ATPase domains